MQRMGRRFIPFLLLSLWLGLLLSPSVSAASVTVSAPTIEGQNGSTVDVPIQIAGASGLGAVHLEIKYDANALGSPEVTRGALAGSNALLESNTKQPGRIVIGIVSLDGIQGDGTVATIHFNVTGAGGTSSALDFQNNQAWERQSHAEVLVNAQSGKVTIAAGLPFWLIPAALAAAAVLLLLLLVLLLSRRRQAPQPAYAPVGYAPAAYAPPTAPPMPRTPLTSAPPSTMPGRVAPPMDLPERRAASNNAVNSAPFKRAEDEYFKLKGQLSTQRITQDEFDNKLRELMVQDSQGRYWMLGTDTGKWYRHDGVSWVEETPY